MIKRVRLSRRIVVIGVAALSVLIAAAGISYATIPDSNKLFTACMVKSSGAVRLIDPSLPASSPMSHCKSSEQLVTWNQQGLPGADGKDGTNGSNGTNGSDGQSVTSAPEPAGAHCTNGGSSFSSVSGTTYACNGADGSSGTGLGHGYTSSLSGPISFSAENTVLASMTLPAGTYLVIGRANLHLSDGPAGQPASATCVLTPYNLDFTHITTNRDNNPGGSGPLISNLSTSATLTAFYSFSQPTQVTLSCSTSDLAAAASSIENSVRAVQVSDVTELN